MTRPLRPTRVPPGRWTPRRRSGVVLVAVLVLTAIASMAAAGLIFRMRAEVAAAAGSTRSHQAYAAALSGVQRAIRVLQDPAADMTAWYDNPDLFRDQLIYDDGADRWYFTVYAADPVDATEVRYGVTDKAGKIDIPA